MKPSWAVFFLKQNHAVFLAVKGWVEIDKIDGLVTNVPLQTVEIVAVVQLVL